MNVVCLVGRLIADPELRQTPQGTSVCSFVISVQRPNAKRMKTVFIRQTSSDVWRGVQPVNLSRDICKR